jgi:hypothetical protein
VSYWRDLNDTDWRIADLKVMSDESGFFRIGGTDRHLPICNWCAFKLVDFKGTWDQRNVSIQTTFETIACRICRQLRTEKRIESLGIDI